VQRIVRGHKVARFQLSVIGPAPDTQVALIQLEFGRQFVRKERKRNTPPYHQLRERGHLVFQTYEILGHLRIELGQLRQRELQLDALAGVRWT
jgi:hypothetical protein